MNVIKMFDCGHDEFKINGGKNNKVFYISTELLSKGELFDMVCETGGFSEPVGRVLMK